MCIVEISPYYWEAFFGSFHLRECISFLGGYFFPPHPGNALQLLSAEFSTSSRRPCWPGTKTISFRLCLLTVSRLVHRKHSCFIVVTSSSGTACRTKSPLLKLIHQTPAAILLPFMFLSGVRYQSTEASNAGVHTRLTGCYGTYSLLASTVQKPMDANFFFIL